MEKENLKAYLLFKDKLYLVFSTNCVKAAKSLAKDLNCDYRDFSVGGFWEIYENSSIELSRFWPYFTNNPPENF